MIVIIITNVIDLIVFHFQCQRDLIDGLLRHAWACKSLIHVVSVIHSSIARARACVRACVRVCVCVCIHPHVFATRAYLTEASFTL